VTMHCSSGTELNIQESIQGTPRFGVPFLRLESHATVRTDEHGSANGCAAQFGRTNRMPINNYGRNVNQAFVHEIRFCGFDLWVDQTKWSSFSDRITIP
jgi:hypothetical protein